MNSSIKHPARSKASKPAVPSLSREPPSSVSNAPPNAPAPTLAQSRHQSTLASNRRQPTTEPLTLRGGSSDTPLFSGVQPIITDSLAADLGHVMSAKRCSFSTSEIRSWHDPRSRNSKTFPTNYPADVFPIGIYMIDIGREHNVRLRAYADNIRPAEAGSYHQFKADFHLDAWADTQLFAAGCCWLDASIHSTDFQFGRYTTGRLYSETYRDILFEGQYSSDPKIVVWLSAIDIDKSNNTRIKAFATNVTKWGFRLRVSTWAKTTVHDATVSWIAVPSDRPNITAGQFNLGDEKRIKFGSDRHFTHPPRVLVALNKLDISKNSNLRIEAKAEDIKKDGMTLSITSWEDTFIYGAGLAYIAIQEFSSDS